MISALRSSPLAIRLLPMALLALLILGTQGCKAKPSEKDCKSAINNVRRINGQDSSDMGADPIAMIRSCRGSSSQKSVECMIAADTEADLESCEGEIGSKYFKKELEATEKRTNESAEDGETKEEGETPAAGDTPSEAAPSEGDTPAAGETPSEGDTPAAGETPSEAAPSEGDTPTAAAASADDKPAEGAAPAEKKTAVPSEEPTKPTPEAAPTTP